MYDKYLVTGATGFLGRAVAERLVRRRAQVYALVLQNDPYINLLPKEVHRLRRVQTRSEALSGQCRWDRAAPAAMYGA